MDPLKQTYLDSIVLHPGRFDEGVRSALLCIDLQYLDAARGQGIFRDQPDEAQAFYFRRLEQSVLPNVQRLQRGFRACGGEVIHVRIQSLTQDGRDRSPAHKRLGLLAPPGSDEARFLPTVAPLEDEIVVNKTASGVFESTNLRFVLSNIGINHLMVVGVYTDECVSTTVRVASDLGFYVTLVEDACTSVTPQLHDSSVATLRDRYAHVISTDEALRGLQRKPGHCTGKASAPLTASANADRRPQAPRTVVLLGGSAFAREGSGLSMDNQFRFAERAVEHLLPLLRDRRELIISHGNGPQVGQMLARVEASLGQAYPVPLEVCVAECEGELGYILVQALHNAVKQHGFSRSVATVLTQTVVDSGDPAFRNPTKPIGPTYGPQEAREVRARGFLLEEGSGGFRRLVPSPEPRELVELDVLQGLLRLGALVVAGGGGGVPVVRDRQGRLRGVHAVVDKDLSGALLAKGIGAEHLIILTSVPYVYLSYGGAEQRPLVSATSAEVAALQRDHDFDPGTIAPKLEAARRFATTGGTTTICDIESLPRALEGQAGTRITDRERGCGE